jgi:hypothetical protein
LVKGAQAEDSQMFIIFSPNSVFTLGVLTVNLIRLVRSSGHIHVRQDSITAEKFLDLPFSIGGSHDGTVCTLLQCWQACVGMRDDFVFFLMAGSVLVEIA